ncbi:sporulation histidine kinase inhibitor Sda [Domibacillus aminovorans]|uniref:Uncharacterized protein n=1 Tax=Domibacillus aminovorans TaxID=29332 RepID=A0A177L9W9_9BACI|nr:sporulation histidine kinase inhibitor Sda [Domibacillus aminovorans]OAH61975.1 hypothetical protein AWH49_11180 [Domibacillus aminovorans]
MQRIDNITEKRAFLSLKVKEGTRENWDMSDEDLLKAHRDAVRLKLDSTFIYLLEREINSRSILLLDDFDKHLSRMEEVSANG